MIIISVVLAFIFDTNQMIAVISGVAHAVFSPFTAILTGIYSLAVGLIHGIINSFTNVGHYLYRNTIGRL